MALSMINDRPSASRPMLNRFHAYYALHSSDQAAQVLLQRGMHAVTSTQHKDKDWKTKAALSKW